MIAHRDFHNSEIKKAMEFLMEIEPPGAKQSLKYSLYYHCTSLESADDIVRNGIKTDTRKCNNDFNTKEEDGFYLTNHLDYVWKWERRRFKASPSIGVLVYMIPPIYYLAEEKEIKVFSRQKNFEDIHVDEWSKTVADNRRGKKTLGQFKLVIGPLSKENEDKRTYQPMEGDQLCTRDQDLATKLNQYLMKVAIVEKESNVYKTLKRPSRRGWKAGSRPTRHCMGRSRH
jgi:hypothetical protein